MTEQSLRETRRRKLLSIRDLAEASSVSTKTIVEIELGRQLPRLDTIRKLATALGVEAVEVAEFMDGIEGKEEPAHN